MPTLLVLKLLLTPTLLLLATLAIRRWGETIGGLVVGLPLTSGPISIFLAVEHGATFARNATAGSLIATAAQAAFGLAYCRIAPRGWIPGLGAGCAAFVAVAVALQGHGWTQGALFLVALGAMVVSVRWSPTAVVRGGRVAPPWWDLPARMALMAGLVVAVTLAAPVIGPEASGVLASFPFMGVIVTVFAHRASGVAAGQLVMRGMVTGLFGFAVFFFVLSLALGRVPLVVAYGCAMAAALGVQAGALWRMRRGGVGEPREGV